VGGRRAVDPARAWVPVWELPARADAVAVIVCGGAGSQVPRPPGRLRGLVVHVLSPQGRKAGGLPDGAPVAQGAVGRRVDVGV
jgi:hypothetical protein